MKEPWIEVDGVKNMPLGDWLVEVEPKDDCDRHRFHVASILPNVQLVGQMFHFDMPKVIRYKPLDV